MQTEKLLTALQHAHSDEINAEANYRAFASQADREGYCQVSYLFQAAADAERIHARNHAAVIKEMGGEPQFHSAPANVKSTRENLEVAIAEETHQSDVIYPKMTQVAAGNVSALRTFKFALDAEAGHVLLFEQALGRLEEMRGRATYCVCRTCGHTTERISIEACPACASLWESISSGYRMTPTN